MSRYRSNRAPRTPCEVSYSAASHRRRRFCELPAPGRVKSCRLLRPVRSWGLAGRARTLGMPGLPGGAIVLGMPIPGVLGCMAPGVAGVSVCASRASLDMRNIASISGTVFMVLFSVRDKRRHSHDGAAAACETRAAGRVEVRRLAGVRRRSLEYAIREPFKRHSKHAYDMLLGALRA